MDSSKIVFRKDYTPLSCALIGDTKPYKKYLKGGRFNPSLKLTDEKDSKRAPGWVFKKDLAPEIEKIYQQIITGEIEPEKEKEEDNFTKVEFICSPGDPVIILSYKEPLPGHKITLLFADQSKRTVLVNKITGLGTFLGSYPMEEPDEDKRQELPFFFGLDGKWKCSSLMPTIAWHY